MADLKIILESAQGEARQSASGADELWMVCSQPYQPGDKLVFLTDQAPGFYIIRVDSCLEESYVYLAQERVEFAIPDEKERMAYPAGCFTGERRYISMRRAREEENGNFRNLAKNIMDRREAQGCYPHAHANAETQGPIAPLFAARNVIDGLLANTEHWPWPYQSWGIAQREDAEITVEFGRPVDVEELRLTTRADFPHDSWWVRGTVSFSDGTSEVVALGKKVEPQAFPIRRKGVAWLKVGQLIRADDPSPFPALTQIEVFGRNSK